MSNKPVWLASFVVVATSLLLQIPVAVAGNDQQKLSVIADMATGKASLPQAAPGSVGVVVGKAKNSKNFLAPFKAAGTALDFAAKKSVLNSLTSQAPNPEPNGPIAFVSLSVAALAALPRPSDMKPNASRAERDAARPHLCDKAEAFCPTFKRSLTFNRPNGSSFITGQATAADGTQHFAWFRTSASGRISGWVSGTDTDFSFTKLRGNDSQALFTVRPVTKGDRYPNDVRRPNVQNMAPASTTVPPRPGDTNPAAGDCVNPPTPQIITVAIKYTEQAQVQALAKGYDIDQQIAIARDIANASLKEANVAGEVRVVSASKAISSEGDTSAKDPFNPILDDLVSQTPQSWKDLVDARDKSKADVGIAVIDNVDDRNCGLAAGYRVSAREAFAVVNWRCMESRFSFIHEIGHLVGLYHDPATRRANDGVADADVIPPYAQGFITPGDHPTASVMAYVTSCPTACGRWPFWSDPARTNQYGAVMGLANQSNETCVWRQRLATVANFHANR